jgi:hypothetical protein
MPGPSGVIMVGPTFEHAYECDVEGVEHAEALAQDEALAADLERMANEAADAKMWVPSSLRRARRRYPSTPPPVMAGC